MGIQIIGTGKYLPDRVVTNDDLAQIVDTSDEWITTRTGIKTRRVETEKATWQMAACAAKEAVEDAGVAPAEIDLVVCSTVTGDYLTPSTACLVAGELGLDSPFCLDVNSACAGFVAAVDLAQHYLASGRYHCALVVSSEMLTKLTDFSDRGTCVLFGDGAGAVVLRAAAGLYESFAGSDPSGGRHLFARGVAPASPFRQQPFDPLGDGWGPSAGHALHMNGREVYKFSTRVLPLCVKTVCERAGLPLEQLDWVFPHQANRRILETAAQNLGLPFERFYLNIDRYGNMSSACIPICLAEASREGLLKRGDKICLVGFGGGLVYAGCLLEW